MTIFGWDASNHDWGRGPMDLAAAVRDGISFATHKVAEGSPGWYVDTHFDDWWQRARAARVPLLGAYYVNHPGDQYAQADYFLSQLDARAPGWRDGPFMLQVDAEKFDYMSRAPNLTEIKAFCGRLVSRTGGKFRPVVYAPQWLYGNTLAGLGYPLWESDYGTNPTVHYRGAYPGDGSPRWAAYSGQTPAILQYGSRLTIGSQPICDANAFRGTLDQLKALLTGDDMDATQDAKLTNANANAWAVATLTDPVVIPGNTPGAVAKTETNRLRVRLDAIDKTLAELKARPPVQSAPVDPAVVQAAVAAALSNPEVLAAVAKAVADENARRQAA